MIVYKVCYRYCGQYISVCQNPLFPRKYRVTYSLNKEITPIIPNTKLFVFKTYDQAKNFASDLFLYYDNFVIFKCYTNKIYKPKQISSVSRIEQFWKIKNAKKKIPPQILYKNEIPAGTLLCDSLTPVEIM